LDSGLWLAFAIVTTLCWGVWGALIEVPEKRGFPATLGYAVWSLTMIPCAAVALALVGWRVEHDGRSVAIGLVAGFLGAGGQLVLFEALRRGPAYLVFPVVALSPVVSVVLAVVFLGESAGGRAWTGIVAALLSLPLLASQPPQAAAAAARGRFWLGLAVLVLLAWGIQAFVLRFAAESMSAEGIFFYMAATAVALAPVAYWMTDFSRPVNRGASGPWLAAAIHLLNSIGALTMVYAFRYGQVIIVSPLINALAPVITIVLSLLLYRVVPHRVVVAGMLLAGVAFFLLA
jgi:drug/metabolite transporter (DMT)-like permease